MTATKGKPDQRYAIADDARHAAATMALAAHRLTDLTHDPLWRPKILTRPLRADLADTRDRITAILEDGGR